MTPDDTVPQPANPTPPDDQRQRIRFVSGAAAVPSQPSWVAPTLAAPHEPSVATTGLPVRQPRHRGRWIAALSALVLVAAGAVVAGLELHSNQPSPSQAVHDYFADLAAGDIISAMALVDDADRYSTSANPLLSSPGALAVVANRPSHVTISGTAATTVDGGNASAVSLTYSVADTTVHQTITVVPRSDAATTAAASADQPYLLRSPFITIALPSATGRALTINGIAIPAKTTHVLAYPGSYVATATGNQLIASVTVPAVYSSASGTVQASISLPAPVPAAGATAVVQAAVDHALDTCARSRAPAPQGCPLRYTDASATMAWQIITYPQISVAINGGEVTFDDGAHPGSAHYAATTTSFFGLIPQTETGSTSVKAIGTVVLADGLVTVRFE